MAELLVAGDLRSFTGQNFERMNNEHRLFWQNSNKKKGEEIPSIIKQHLRVRMNPVRRLDLVQFKLQCSLCSHPPFTYKKNFIKHVTADHPSVDDVPAFFKSTKAAVAERLELTRLSVKAFASFTTDVSFPMQVADKSSSNKTDYEKHKTARKEFKKKYGADADV